MQKKHTIAQTQPANNQDMSTKFDTATNSHKESQIHRSYIIYYIRKTGDYIAHR